MSLELILVILLGYGLLCAFGENMWCFLRKLLNFLLPAKDLSGEVLVTGKDSFTLDLHRHPKEISVFFKDERNLVPCNPSHEDLIWFTESCDSCHHKLTIKWDVDGMRAVIWRVKF